MDESSMLSIFNRENRLLLLVVFGFFCVCVFFSENLTLLFLQLGGGERWRGFFLENIFVFL